jgi:hypothetical protein
VSSTGTLADEPASHPPQGHACYVYGVVAAEESLPPGPVGIDGEPLRSVRCGSVAAVVVHLTGDRELGRRADLLSHRDVLDTLAGTTAVVPVRFGSVMADERSVVEDLLMPGEEEFSAMLEALAGRSQFILSIAYQADTALSEIVRSEPEIAELRRLTRDLPEEQSYAQRVRLGELVAHAMEEKRGYDAQVVLDAVRRYVVEHMVRDGGGLERVADVALLVDHSMRDELEQQLEWLAEAVHERMRLQLKGPMAPYDFVGDI